jgi:hypothetical protein
MVGVCALNCTGIQTQPGSEVVCHFIRIDKDIEYLNIYVIFE